jgi:hypothetical protein
MKSVDNNHLDNHTFCKYYAVPAALNLLNVEYPSVDMYMQS